MISEIFSAATCGVDAYIVRVETHFDRSAQQAFTVVGLPDNAIKEARERVSAAIKNSNLVFPTLKRITINLSPADIRKEGSSFDLPIAIGLLTESNQIKVDNVKKYVMIGELSLDGHLRRVPGILPMTVTARKEGFYGVILPNSNADEAAVVEGIDIFPFETLTEVIDFLNCNLKRVPHKITLDSIFKYSTTDGLDFADVKGQNEVKRAVEIAAAGGHNIIMIGLPGSGKTMIAKRIPSILPPLTLEEAIETTKIHSVAGILSPNTALVTNRPFRSPHHTASDVAIVGGGPNAKPGEISFAHNGVLFLDEITEFKKNVLESLRQPLEDKVVTIARSKLTVKYPCNFMLVAAMNPTPAGSQKELLNYSEYELRKYVSKISGPILDRIDMHIHVNPVDITSISHCEPNEPSNIIRERVIKARNLQLERYQHIKGVYSNANLTSAALRKYCWLDSKSQSLLNTAITKLSLSARAYDKILKLSRTIADLEGSESILIHHVSEAIQYRSLDREGWLL
ncbi:MAG: YifB family Mg chelatase-like AAA ATPase [Ignavibacteria bacterium]